MMREIQKKLEDIILKNYNLKIITKVEVPAHSINGDYSTNVAMLLTSEVGKPPYVIANEIKDALDDKTMFEKVEVAGAGFINFFLKDTLLFKNTVQSVLDNSLIPTVVSNDKIIVEHTSVNPNKAMHVGHIRNAILGDSIRRLLKRVGYKVETHNYVDDTGVQVADTINGLLHLNIKQLDNQKFDDYCWDVYTKINSEYTTSSELLEKRKAILHEIEQGSGPIAQKAKEVVDKIFDCHLELLNEFGIDYDLAVFESDIIGFGFWETAFEQLKKSPNFVFAEEGEYKGCWTLKYDTEEFGDKIFVRSNGTKVYTAKDTAYHLWKFGLLDKDFLYKSLAPKFSNTWITSNQGIESEKFGHAKSIINVIDERQAYPQEMVKHALHSLGYTKEASKYTHIAYGVVSLSRETAEALGVDTSSNKNSYAMSGRNGIGVKVTNLVKLLESKVKGIQSENENNNLDETNLKKIVIGAIKHYMLKYNPNSAITFDYTQATRLVGNTGPYLQYSHVRANKILQNVGEFPITYEYKGKITEVEWALIKKIAELPMIIEATLDSFNMSLLADYAYALSKTFHSFYESSPVVTSEETLKHYRATLTKTYVAVIQDVLGILGISAPEKM